MIQVPTLRSVIIGTNYSEEVLLGHLRIGFVEKHEPSGRWMASVDGGADAYAPFDEKSEAIQHLVKVHYERADEIVHWEIHL